MKFTLPNLTSREQSLLLFAVAYAGLYWLTVCENNRLRSQLYDAAFQLAYDRGVTVGRAGKPPCGCKGATKIEATGER